VKLDLHVHTYYSGNTTIYPLSLFLKESYNSPEGVYRRAKARGMDLVTITDRVDGAMTIADRPDVIVGCEVTGCFPDDGLRVHLGVLGLNETQHHEIQRLRRDVRELLPYLRRLETGSVTRSGRRGNVQRRMEATNEERENVVR
jgi:predicted metal-dependent phosphoesterase TrpH